jgi:hypothetical protein
MQPRAERFEAFDKKAPRLGRPEPAWAQSIVEAQEGGLVRQRNFRGRSPGGIFDRGPYLGRQSRFRFFDLAEKGYFYQ